MHRRNIGGVAPFVKEYEIPEMLHAGLVLLKIYVLKKRRKRCILKNLFVKGSHKKCGIGFGAKVSHAYNSKCHRPKAAGPKDRRALRKSGQAQRTNKIAVWTAGYPKPQKTRPPAQCAT